MIKVSPIALVRLTGGRTVGCWPQLVTCSTEHQLEFVQAAVELLVLALHLTCTTQKSGKHTG